MAADLITPGNERQVIDINALLHHGHVVVGRVVANGDALLAILEHDFDRLIRKALLRHALNASYIAVTFSLDLLYSFDIDI